MAKMPKFTKCKNADFIQNSLVTVGRASAHLSHPAVSRTEMPKSGHVGASLSIHVHMGLCGKTTVPVR